MDAESERKTMTASSPSSGSTIILWLSVIAAVATIALAIAVY